MDKIKKLFEELNKNKDNNLTNIYLELQKCYEEKLGKNTIVMIEVGKFFEMYQVGEKGRVKEISYLLNIQLTRKNKSIEEISIKNPLMSGIPSISLEKYLNRILETELWTVVLIKQYGETKNIKRELDRIISPGTTLEVKNSEDDNYITSIYFEEHKNNNISIGIVSIDVSTGNVYEIEHINIENEEILIEKINSFLDTYKTKEILFISDVNNLGLEKLEKIIEKVYLENINYLIKEINTNNIDNTYQNKIIKSKFNTNTFLSPIEEINFELKFFSNFSLITLLEFIEEHDISISEKLKYPILLDDTDYLYLGNNTLRQLNIISSHLDNSVLNIINKSLTPMGRRLVKNRIKQPIKNKIEIERRYKLGFEISKSNLYLSFKENLKNIFDIERLNRKISLNILQPYEINQFINSINEIKLLINKTNIEINDLIPEKINIKDIEEICSFFEERFILDTTYKYNFINLNENLIKENISREIDSFNEKLKVIEIEIEIERKKISDLFDSKTDIKFSFTDKEGYYFELTKKKYDLIKDKLKDYNKKILTGNVKIYNKRIEEISNLYILEKTKIINLNKKIFIEYYEEFFELFNKKMVKIINYISEIDNGVSNSILLKEKKYSIPEIIDTEESFIEVEELRHPIIETIEKNGIYIPNDICIGNKDKALNKKSLTFQENEHIKGVLLYGINSSGKSSYMKSIGISIILAQSGFFVPANKLRFSIFDKIFTRISGDDNIYKGLSTFTVEMLELKNILSRSKTGKNLILGDEISHGTETVSGISIVSSAVHHLSKTNSVFMFATHLHQLNSLEIIKENKNIVNLHLSIYYDKEKEIIIYDRKLKYGNGDTVYGLEFAESLKLDKDFINTAKKIRKIVSEEYDDFDLIIKNKRTKYNNDLIIERCCFCNSLADDVHHISEKHTADENKMIKHFKKNHKFNLIPLCKKHHLNIHKIMKNYKDTNIDFIKYIDTDKGKSIWVNPIIIDELDINENIRNENIFCF